MAKKKIKIYPIWYLEDAEAHNMTEEEVIANWQHFVDNGLVWKMQGWYGRNAQAMLDAGILKYPKEKTKDFYGNPIPTRK